MTDRAGSIGDGTLERAVEGDDLAERTRRTRWRLKASGTDGSDGFDPTAPPGFEDGIEEAMEWAETAGAAASAVVESEGDLSQVIRYWNPDEGQYNASNVSEPAQGMEALASNFDDVPRQGGTEQRSGELTLRDGVVRTGCDGGTLTIEIDGNGKCESVPIGSLTYQYGSSTVAYDGGGLFQGRRR